MRSKFFPDVIGSSHWYSKLPPTYVQIRRRKAGDPSLVEMQPVHIPTGKAVRARNARVAAYLCTRFMDCAP